VKHDIPETPSEIEAALSLKRCFLRAALAIAGGARSSAEATLVAALEASRLKGEIAALERRLETEHAHPQAA
jgi:hypothetical protein